jgi:enterochelin esterase-like enzyme
MADMPARTFRNSAGILAALIFVSAAALARGMAASELRIHTLESKVFGNVRNIRVLLPPGYDERGNASKRYPVLYLNDGQNLFDKATSVFNPMEWGVDETVAKLSADKSIPPIIVVGIDNAGRSGREQIFALPGRISLTAAPGSAGKKISGISCR